MTAKGRMIKILKGDKKQNLGVVQRPDGTYTTDAEETLKVMLNTHFPGNEVVTDTSHLKGKGQRTTWNPGDESELDDIVHADKIIWAIKRFKPYKSPGPDKVYPSMLQQGLEQIIPELKEIFRASLRLSHVPQVWSTTKVIFLPKPGKETYDNPKSYRPISLSSFILKTLERLVDIYLRNQVLSTNPLQQNQFAYQKGKSTETALHALTYKLGKSMKEGTETLAAFFDIQGAFDNAPTHAITKALTAKLTKPHIVGWINHMLETRHVTAELENSNLIVRTTRGCPQGGVLSPLLWCLIVDDLLKVINGNGIYAQAYSDDGVLVVSGIHRETIVEIMEQGLETVLAWCRARGLSINPVKTELVWFTRKRTTSNLYIKLDGMNLSPKNEVKYLGVTLDSRLNFDKHVSTLCTKATRIWSQVYRVVGQKWGLKPSVTNWLYITVTRPVLTYAAVIWWQASNRFQSLKTLEKVQRLALMYITGSVRSTPTSAIEKCLGMTPIGLSIAGEAIKGYLRILRNNDWKPKQGENYGHLAISELMTTKLGKHIPHATDSGPEIWLPNNRFEIINESRQWWDSNQVPPASERSVMCYTDGSKLKDGSAGSAVYLERTGETYMMPLHNWCSVLQAEVIAITKAAELLITTEVANKTISIYTDSKSSLSALGALKTNSHCIKQCSQALNKLSESNQVTLYWLPGHTGHVGNEVADTLARRASTNSQKGIGEKHGDRITNSELRKSINLWQQAEMHTVWKNKTSARQSKLFLREGQNTHYKTILSLPRADISKVVGILTGHNTLNRHLSIMRIREDAECEFCGVPESAEHYLLECDRYHHIRTKLDINPGWSCQTSKDVKTLLTYINETKRFKQFNRP